MVMTRDSPGHNTPKRDELCKLQLRSCDGKQDHIQEQTEVSGVFPMKMPELHMPGSDGFFVRHCVEASAKAPAPTPPSKVPCSPPG